MVVQLYNDIKYNVLYFEKSLFCLKKLYSVGKIAKIKKNIYTKLSYAKLLRGDKEKEEEILRKQNPFKNKWNKQN